MTAQAEDNAVKGGRTLPYLGQPVTLGFADTKDTAISPCGTRLILPHAREIDEQTALLHWYTARTEEIIRRLLPAWSKKLALRPRGASVRCTKTRWGSCSVSGWLSFNSRLAMLSPDIAEYIVVHELCHLKQMNHGKAFWNEVASALPNCASLRAKLRREEKTARL